MNRFLGNLVGASVAMSALPAVSQTDFAAWEAQMVACQRLVLKLQSQWGESPDAYFSGNPNVSGQLPKGTFVRLLGSTTMSDGSRLMRVEVFPEDGEKVGKSNNKVWVHWGDNPTSKEVLQMAYGCED